MHYAFLLHSLNEETSNDFHHLWKCACLSTALYGCTKDDIEVMLLHCVCTQCHNDCDMTAMYVITVNADKALNRLAYNIWDGYPAVFYNHLVEMILLHRFVTHCMK